MPLIKTGPRVVVSVVATGGGDWQVASTPTGFNGITSALFADNDYIHGFVRFENGVDWEEYDTDDDSTTSLLQVANISGTVTITRPATPYNSSNGGARVSNTTGTHTLALSIGAGTVERIFREINGSWKTFTSGDATPDVSDYRLFKTAGTTTITAFDGMEAGKVFFVQRGASDITIADGASISLPGDRNLTLTTNQPIAMFVEDGGVAVLIATFPSLLILQNGVAATELTISSGAVTPTQASHTVDTEGDASSDDLDTITATNFKAGDVLTITPANAARTIVVKHNTGNIKHPRGYDVTLDDVTQTAQLRYDGTSWNIITASEGLNYADTYSQLTGFTSTRFPAGSRVYLKYRTTEGDGGEGFFRTTTADISTEVAADTLGGLYVPFSGGNGSTGGFVRDFHGDLQAEWFGVSKVNSGSTNATNLNAAITTAHSLFGGAVILFKAGTYPITDTITIQSKDGIVLAGAGIDATILDFNGIGATKDGVRFLDQSWFGGLRDLTVANATRNGVTIEDTVGSNPFTMRFINVALRGNGGRGLYSKDGFMMTLENVRAWNNTGGGIHLTGYHTTINATDCHCLTNTGPGWEIDDISYSCFTNCGADTNGDASTGLGAGYKISNAHAVTFIGCGGENNKETAFYVNFDDGTQSIVDGADGLSFIGCYGYNNDRGADLGAARASAWQANFMYVNQSAGSGSGATCNIIVQGCRDLNADGSRDPSTTYGGPSVYANGSAKILRLASDFALAVTLAGSAVSPSVGSDGTIACVNISTSGFLSGGTNGTSVTIASGAVTATGSYHFIDTEAAAASDDLDTVNGGYTGSVLVFRLANSSRIVTFKDGTGNLSLKGDFVPRSNADFLMLWKSGSTWFEIARSINSAYSEVAVTIDTNDEITIPNGDGGVSTLDIKVSTNGGAGTDNLAGIIGGKDGDRIRLRANDSTKDVVLKHNGTVVSGAKLYLNADFTMDHLGDMAQFQRIGGAWYCESKQDNAT